MNVSNDLCGANTIVLSCQREFGDSLNCVERPLT